MLPHDSRVMPVRLYIHTNMKYTQLLQRRELKSIPEKAETQTNGDC
jgi:hypothetical protein